MKHKTRFLVGAVSLVLSAPSFADLSDLKKAGVSNQQANSTIVKDVQKGARVVVRRPAARPMARTTAVVATPARTTAVVATPATTTAVVKTPTTTVVKTPNAAVVRTPAPRARVRVVR